MKFNRRTFLTGAAATTSLWTATHTRALSQAQPRLLEARTGALQLNEGTDTAILGFDGTVPGPLLKIRQGEALNLNLINKLDQPTSIHWRGMRAPNAFDGVAPLTQKPVGPGESFNIAFTPPDAGTFFYHAHSEPHMAQQVERGLYGVLIVEELEPPAVDHDVLAVIDDWSLTDGQIALCAGRTGTLLTVNAKLGPLTQIAAPGARIRLRLVNAASARIMAISFEGARPFVVAIDGQPCRAFEPVRASIPVGPGARFDVMFDMPNVPDAKVRVILRGGQLGDSSGEPDPELSVFTSRGDLQPARPPIEGPALNPLLPEEIRLQTARRLDLALESVDGDPGLACANGKTLWRLAPPKPVKAGAPLLSVKRGTAVSLGFVNRSQIHQVMRLHGHVMRQLHLLDDGWEPYWRDSVIVPPGRTVRVAFVADNPGRWRIGSGIMAHAAGGMSGFFEVT